MLLEKEVERLSLYEKFIKMKIKIKIVDYNQATFDISLFKHGSEAFRSKLQSCQGYFVCQFPNETWVQRK